MSHIHNVEKAEEKEANLGSSQPSQNDPIHPASNNKLKVAFAKIAAEVVVEFFETLQSSQMLDRREVSSRKEEFSSRSD